MARINSSNPAAHVFIEGSGFGIVQVAIAGKSSVIMFMTILFDKIKSSTSYSFVLIFRQQI